MKKIFLVLMLGIFALQGTMAQQRSCYAYDYHNEQLEKDPGYAQRMRDLESFTSDFVRNYKQDPAAKAVDVITIPVVVKVIWRTAAENISDAQIRSQIDVLNADFRKLNADIGSVIPEFAGITSDFELEFCLATVDPNGNPTTGIERRQTTRTSWGTDNQMKFASQGGIDAWPRDKYLNMWVCVLSGGILGYATFPGGAANVDGVVTTTTAFGTTGNVTAPFNKGRTTTHEVGHWLNLRHIWGDDGTACTGSDQVNDTPNQAGPTYGCNTTKATCGSRDNTQNYMDYSDDACMMMFTEGQKARARALFAPGGARAAIRNSNGCGAPAPTCNAPTGVTISNIANTSAGLSFTAATNATSYRIERQTVGTTTWTVVATTSSTAANLSGLSACTDYNIRVISICSTGESQPSATASFKTTGCTAPACAVPTGLKATRRTSNSVTISWTAVSGASSYNVRQRVLGGTNWNQVNTTATSRVFTGLNTSRQYEYQVQAVCGSATSAWSASVTYNPRTGGAARESGINEYSLQVFPNPAKGILNLSYSGESVQNAVIILMDVSGRVVLSERRAIMDGAPLQLDISGITPGLYFVQLQGVAEEMPVQRVIIQ